MKRYDTYKDIMLPCFKGTKAIPSHWSIVPLRYLFYNLDYLRKPIAANERPQSNPVYDYYGASGVIDKIDFYNVEDTVLLIGEDGANLRMRNLPLIYKAKGRFWVNNHAHILKPINDSYDYMFYLLESMDYYDYITGAAQPKLSQESLNKIRTILPPLSEQHSIVTYLDDKCGKIDKMVEGKQKQIELLAEMKQRIIADAVTRGLNPDVKMKATNIPWLPEIPEHWEMESLRRFLTLYTEKGHGDKQLLSVTREQGVILRNTDSKEENHNFIPEDLSGYKYVQAGDFVINKMKSWQGSYGVSEHEGIVSPAYFTCKLQGVDKDFFSTAIRSKTYVSFFARYSKGIRVDQWDLSPVALKSIPFALPPLDEQHAIVSYITDKTTKIDTLTANLQQEIESIKEYKQRLISDVVTGQIKVC